MKVVNHARMPLDQIELLFPAQWILVDQPVLDAWNRVVDGVPVFAHSEKTEVHRKIGELKLTRFAIQCTKKDPPDRKYM